MALFLFYKQRKGALSSKHLARQWALSSAHPVLGECLSLLNRVWFVVSPR